MDWLPGYPAPSTGRALNLRHGGSPLRPAYLVSKLKSLNGERKRGLLTTKTRRESGHEEAKDDSIPFIGSKAAEGSPWRQKVGVWSEALGDEGWRLMAHGDRSPLRRREGSAARLCGCADCHCLAPGAFPGGSADKESVCRCRRHGFLPWFGRIPWSRKWQPTPVFLPGESPWTEEPGGLRSAGSQRVGHDLATEHTGLHPV